MLNFKSVNRNQVRQQSTFQILPKDAYVIKILSVKIADNNKGGQRLDIAFDIAEGEYKDFYRKQFDANTNEDKKWPFDAIHRVNIPTDNAPEWMSQNFFTFLANVEDSNPGYTFDGNEQKLKGKVVGALMHNEQSEANGNVYDHTRVRWTRPAADVREHKYGSLPKDKLIGAGSRAANAVNTDEDGFVKVPTNNPEEDELPF